MSGPTRSVTSAFTLILAPVGLFTQTYSFGRMPRSAAAFGLISTKLSCISSASHGLERVSSPPPSYSTRRPLVRMSGNFSATPSLTLRSCTDLNSVGSRQSTFTSSCVGYFATRSGRGEYSASRCSGTPIGEVPHQRPRLRVAEGVATVVLHEHADLPAGEVGLPVLALRLLLLVLGELVPPAELLQQHVVELGVAELEVGALRGRAVLGEQAHAVALDAEVGAEVAAAVHHRLRGVVEVRRARVLQLRVPVARPRQAEVVAGQVVAGLRVLAALGAQASSRRRRACCACGPGAARATGRCSRWSTCRG